jgi:hypothetical protein
MQGDVECCRKCRRAKVCVKEEGESQLLVESSPKENGAVVVVYNHVYFERTLPHRREQMPRVVSMDIALK